MMSGLLSYFSWWVCARFISIQVVNIKAEQLAGLSQTLFEYHDKLHHFQLKTICSLVYDIAGEIHDWTEKEEEIVMSLEEEARRNG